MNRKNYIEYPNLKVHFREARQRKLLCGLILKWEWLYNWTTIPGEITCKICLRKWQKINETEEG